MARRRFLVTQVANKGRGAAITVTARKLAVIIWNMITKGKFTNRLIIMTLKKKGKFCN